MGRWRLGGGGHGSPPPLLFPLFAIGLPTTPRVWTPSHTSLETGLLPPPHMSLAFDRPTPCGCEFDGSAARFGPATTSGGKSAAAVSASLGRSVASKRLQQTKAGAWIVGTFGTFEEGEFQLIDLKGQVLGAEIFWSFSLTFWVKHWSFSNQFFSQQILCAAYLAPPPLVRQTKIRSRNKEQTTHKLTMMFQEFARCCSNKK